MSNLTAGTVAFSNLTEHEIYNGRSTGKFSLTLRLDESEAAKLDAKGVKLREYEGVQQRKFASKYPIKVVDLDNDPVQGELGVGSEVRVAWSGRETEEFGTVTYLEAVRVVQLEEPSSELPSEF